MPSEFGFAPKQCLAFFSFGAAYVNSFALFWASRVYSELSQVRDNLTHPRFQLTEEEEEADIIWAYNHIKDYRSATK